MSIDLRQAATVLARRSPFESARRQKHREDPTPFYWPFLAESRREMRFRDLKRIF
jgi:hypothetical protein